MPRHRSWLPRCIAAFLLLALMPANVIHFHEAPPERQHIRFQIVPPEGVLEDFKLSSHGRFLAFCADKDGLAKIWIRALDNLEMRLLTSFAAPSRALFWSADEKASALPNQDRASCIRSPERADRRLRFAIYRAT